MESRIAAGAWPLRHGWRAAKEMGDERARAGWIPGSHQRSTGKNFAPGRRGDRPCVTGKGRYRSAQSGEGQAKSFLWTRKAQGVADVRGVSDALLRTTKVYDQVFGARTKESSSTWIVECPVAAGCFTRFTRATAVLRGDEEGEPTTAEMVSMDTMMVDLGSGTP